MFENRENLFYLKLPTRNYSYFHRKSILNGQKMSGHSK